MRTITTLFILLLHSTLVAQSSLFYFGGGGHDEAFDIHALSNGDFLVAGSTDQLDWIPSETEIIRVDGGAINHEPEDSRYPFLMLLSSDWQQVKIFWHLEEGQAENIRFIKTTNLPRTSTGQMFISGTTEGPEGGYFIAKLNGNFVDKIPDELEWVVNVKCAEGDYPKNNQPWDVDGEGHVYYVRGDSHGYNWSAMYRLNTHGEKEVVEHWRTHWKKEGGEFRGTPASDFSGGRNALLESAIVFKRDGRCNMRSWTQADYEWVTPDGNGGTKQGKWPMDMLFSGPCHPDSSSSTSGPGYTGYRPPGIFTYGPSVVTADRQSGEVYLGINMRSVLPGGNPDFEPAVVKFGPEGELLWWSRLYHEVRPDGSKHNSTPDQYIDGIALDYEQGDVVVNARCHGNNVENFWEGNTIAIDSTASSFQNRFTGTQGNIHISWLGRLSEDGILKASTYVAEMPNGAKGAGAPMTDPLMDGWPNPNAAWPDLNTTRLIPNTVKVSADGHVIVAGQGRRTMTTSNAFQKMPKPGNGSTSRWNHFIRQYEHNFSRPLYSSIVAGLWDTLNEQPGLDIRIRNFFKVKNGFVFVGQHNGLRGAMPTAQIPEWGKAAYDSTDAVIGWFQANEIYSEADDVVVKTTSTTEDQKIVLDLWPNPGDLGLYWKANQSIQRIEIYDACGNMVQVSSDFFIPTVDWPDGVYLISFFQADGEILRRKWVKQASR